MGTQVFFCGLQNSRFLLCRINCVDPEFGGLCCSGGRIRTDAAKQMRMHDLAYARATTAQDREKRLILPFEFRICLDFKKSMSATPPLSDLKYFSLFSATDLSSNNSICASTKGFLFAVEVLPPELCFRSRFWMFEV